MSIWDSPELNQPETDPNSRFINKALNDGDSIVLKFDNLLHQEQPENSKYPTHDGMEWNFFFKDENEQERTIKQNGPKGFFFKSMKAANIEPGDFVEITRHDTEMEFDDEAKMVATWKIVKVDGFPVAPKKTLEESIYGEPEKKEISGIDPTSIPF